MSDVAKRGFAQQWRLPLPGAAGAELARVLGGGVVPGSLTLVGGDPGVGCVTSCTLCTLWQPTCPPGVGCVTLRTLCTLWQPTRPPGSGASPCARFARFGSPHAPWGRVRHLVRCACCKGAKKSPWVVGCAPRALCTLHLSRAPPGVVSRALHAVIGRTPREVGCAAVHAMTCTHPVLLEAGAAQPPQQ